MNTLILLFVCDKYCLIINKIDSKDLSHKLWTNYVISYFLSVFNVPYIVIKFDVMENIKNFAKFSEN